MRSKTTSKELLAALFFLVCIGNIFAQADLSLGLTQQIASPQQWSVYSVTATLTNDGPQAASGVEVSIPLPAGVVYTGGNEFSSSAGSFSPYGNRVWTVPSLAVGSSQTLTINYFLRVPNAPLGYAEVIASDQADPDSTPGNGTPPAVNEDDEASTVTPTGGGLPDLSLSNLNVSNSPLAAGGILQYTFTAENGGTGNAPGNFSILAYLSTDAVLSPDDIQDGQIPTGNFAAGDIVAGINGASNTAALSPGNYFLILKIDGNENVAESNENNNVIARPFSISGPTGGQVDLSVSISQNVAQPAQFTLYSVTASVTNSGSQPATGVVLSLPIPAGVVYQGGNEFSASQGSFTLFGPGAKQWEVGTLGANQSASITINYFLNAATSADSYVEVLAANEQDVDSTPGNGNGQVNEDDEASTGTTTGPTCNITANSFRSICNDQGTPNDPSDDRFTVELNVSNGSASGNYTVLYLGQSIATTAPYGTSAAFDGGPIGSLAGTNVAYSIIDAADPACMTVIFVTVPDACSGPTCNITASVLSIDCDDQGTAIETDDTYSVTFLVENGGASGTWTADNGGANPSFSGSYGVPFTLQGGNIFNTINLGGLTLSVNITDDIAATCATTLTWQTPGATCSSAADPCDALVEFQAVVPTPEKVTLSDDDAGNFTVNYTTPNGTSSSFTFDAVAVLGVTPVQLNTVTSRDIVCKSNGGFALTGAYRDIVNPGLLRPFMIQLDAAGNVSDADVIVFANPNLDVNSFSFIGVGPNGGTGDVFFTEIFTGSRSYFIAAIDEANNILWESQPIGDLVTNRIWGTVLTEDKSRIYLSYRDGNSISWPRLRGVNVSDGSTDWEVRLGDLSGLSTSLPITGDPSAPLLTANDEVVVGINVRGLNSGLGTLRFGVRIDRNGNVVYLAQQPGPLSNSFDPYVPQFESSTGAIVFSGMPATVVVSSTGETELCIDNQVDLELTAVSANQQPQQYTVNSITFTLTNNGGSTATGVLVDVSKPSEVVYTGGNEFTASQGILSTFGVNTWTVGDLAPGATATLVVNYFSLSTSGYTQYAEVSAVNETDVDSSPNNGNGTSAIEDDEVFLDLTGPTTQALTFFPNPLPQGEQLLLDFVSSGESRQTMLFSDLTGRPVQTVEVTFQEGRNQIPVDLGMLPAGVYIVAFPQSGLPPKRIIVQE